MSSVSFPFMHKPSSLVIGKDHACMFGHGLLLFWKKYLHVCSQQICQKEIYISLWWVVNSEPQLK